MSNVRDDDMDELGKSWANLENLIGVPDLNKLIWDVSCSLEIDHIIPNFF